MDTQIGNTYLSTFNYILRHWLALYKQREKASTFPQEGHCLVKKEDQETGGYYLAGPGQDQVNCRVGSCGSTRNGQPDWERWPRGNMSELSLDGGHSPDGGEVGRWGHVMLVGGGRIF